MALGSKRRFTDREVVIAWQGFAVEVGGMPHVIPTGTRLRGDHPVVRHSPEAFVRDGTPEGEWPTRFDAVVEVHEERARAAAKLAPPPAPPRIDPATPISDLRVCITTILNSVAGRCTKGTIVTSSDPLVAAAPEAFGDFTAEMVGA